MKKVLKRHDLYKIKLKKNIKQNIKKNFNTKKILKKKTKQKNTYQIKMLSSAKSEFNSDQQLVHFNTYWRLEC